LQAVLLWSEAAVATDPTVAPDPACSQRQPGAS